MEYNEKINNINVIFNIKKYMRITFIRLITYIGFVKRIINHTINKKEINNNILIYPPASPGSLGDEAMELAFLCHKYGKMNQKYGLIALSKNDNWNHLPNITKIIPYASLQGSIIELLKFFYNLSSFDKIYIIGADIMDGGYSKKVALDRLKLATIASKMGLQTAIVNFSVNNNVPEEIIEAFVKLPQKVRLVCRDSVSQQRLSLLTGRIPELSADVAFLLKPALESPLVLSVFDWICKERSQGRTIIGVNINPQVLGKNISEIKIYQLIDSYSITINNLMKGKDNYSIVFLPHDFRGLNNDLTLTQLIVKQLPKDLLMHCILPNIPYNPREIKAICTRLEFIFTGRMHLAILGLGVGVPVACIGYQGKFEGLFKHYKLESQVISSESALNSEQLSNFFFKSISNRGIVKTQIGSLKSKIIKLAENNLPN